MVMFPPKSLTYLLQQARALYIVLVLVFSGLADGPTAAVRSLCLRFTGFSGPGSS